MAVENEDIAQIFDQYADLLEIEGGNAFRVRAYRNAARIIQGLPHSVTDMLAEGEDLDELPGIGKDLAAKMKAIVRTGELAELEEAKRQVPAGLLDVVQIPGIGPKRAKLLYEELGIAGTEELAQAARAERLRALPGFGPKSEQNILSELEPARRASSERIFLSEADRIARRLTDYLRRIPGVEAVAVAGSYRRGKETVGDLDVVVTYSPGSDVMDRFTAYDQVERIVSKGQTRSTVFLRSGLQVDLRAMLKESYGAALHYFTGSMEHNVAVRHLGVKRGLKINEYGVFRGDERVAGKTEEEVYAQVGLPYIDPELREARGELEEAVEGKLPQLVALDDIRGDLHSHTTASDGHDSLEAMARAAQERGYEYLAITEHSSRIAHGLDAEHMATHIKRIEGLNKRLNGLTLLRGAEVDILENGSLDLPDDILKELDLVLGAAHYKYDLPRKEQTERILRAMDNRYVSILAHPLSRHIGERKPIDVDMDRVILAAKENGIALEVNAQPKRMDLDDLHARMAKEAGVMLVISTDSHSAEALDDMRFGVSQARRGWLVPADVLNSRSLADVRKQLRTR